MPHLIEAGKAGATLGEMCDVFREAFGVYRDPARCDTKIQTLTVLMIPTTRPDRRAP